MCRSRNPGTATPVPAPAPAPERTPTASTSAPSTTTSPETSSPSTRAARTPRATGSEERCEEPVMWSRPPYSPPPPSGCCSWLFGDLEAVDPDVLEGLVPTVGGLALDLVQDVL